MKLAVAVYPKNKVSTTTIVLSYGLVVVIVSMVVSQLMTIEKFLPIIQSYQLPGGLSTAKITVFLLATSGIFALPFLMRMGLSPLFRICSALCLNLYAIIWLKLALWLALFSVTVPATGVFGSLHIASDQEILLVLASTLLCIAFCVTWFLRNDLKQIK